ncbi:MAG: endonuclease domain-containing protein [Kiritimatiellae bacterium]|nr:endonuclease domain-containing protein [Kiritimatiellia bacterium]
MRRIIPYNPKLKERARQLRRNMTLAEIKLWKALKSGQMLGHDFDRQRPLGDYIVDFFCKDLCLAIEVDGCSHDCKEREDDRRQHALEALGVRFLRFWDSEVKNDLVGVLQSIEEWILAHGGQRQRAHPRPLPGRGGEEVPSTGGDIGVG